MRQGQQNRRGRGRGGRKPQNPLARSFESNGPDVKIRGTAAHIAEKYTSLARDALAAGDLVAAESYLQHAEHYNRIIMAAQQQFGQHNNHPGAEGANGGGSFRPRFSSDGTEPLDEGGSEFEGDGYGMGDEIRAPQGRDFQQPREGREAREPREGREAQHHQQNQPQHHNRRANGAGGAQRESDEEGGEGDGEQPGGKAAPDVVS